QRRPGDRQVADLAGAAGPAAVQPAAQHHRHAHAAVEPHEGEVVGALRGAVRALGDGGEVDVVLYRHRTPQVGAQRGEDALVPGGQVERELDVAGRRIDHARGADHEGVQL